MGASPNGVQDILLALHSSYHSWWDLRGHMDRFRTQIICKAPILAEILYSSSPLLPDILLSWLPGCSWLPECYLLSPTEPPFSFQHYSLQGLSVNFIAECSLRPFQVFLRAQFLDHYSSLYSCELFSFSGFNYYTLAKS